MACGVRLVRRNQARLYSHATVPMIAYVESNFILEISYLQEQHASCEVLLALAESSQLQLVLPAYSVSEARLSLQGKMHRRRVFAHQLQSEIREFSRSKPYQD